MRTRDRGFTLVELAFVLAVIGALIAGVLIGGSAVVKRADALAMVDQIGSIKAGVAHFRERYHFWPGDYPAKALPAPLPGLSTPCKDGDGNGLIGAAESPCVLPHLMAAQLAGPTLFSSKYAEITFEVVSIEDLLSKPPGLKASIRNVLLLKHVPCFMARAVEQKIDNDDLANAAQSGSVGGVAGECLDDDVSIDLVVAL